MNGATGEGPGEAPPVIAVDGPNAAGKGTLCSQLARQLGWHLLDSGALYRLVALCALREGIDAGDVARLADAARTLQAGFLAPAQSEPAGVTLKGEEVTAELRTEPCADLASRIAGLPEVRTALLARQRAFARAPGLVADGRDMGTVVFPAAALKIFLTASARERALRRYKQLRGKGIDVNLAALSSEIAQRDRRDRERAAAPLRPAADAVIIDTSGHSAGEVLERVVELVKARGLAA